MDPSQQRYDIWSNMSHRTRATETVGILPITSGLVVPQLIPVSRVPADQTTSSAQRYSVTSVSSSGRRSRSIYDGSNKPNPARTSGIPRSTSASSQARLSIIASTRPAPLLSSKSPTTRSTPAMATMNRDQIQSAMAKSRSQKQQSTMNDDSHYMQNVPVSMMDTDRDSVLGIAFPERKARVPIAGLPARLIPELQALAASSQRPQIATGSISSVSSPSTVFTASPSPWSASTANTTPVSWSSTSPSVMQTSGSPATNKRSHTVPIPAVTRTRLPKLPVVQEITPKSSLSSPNNLRLDVATPPRRLKKGKSTPSPVPTPPPRSSSIRRTRSRSDSRSEEYLHVPEPDVPPPLPTEQRISTTLPGLLPDRLIRSPFTSNPPDLVMHHNTLQHALNSIPAQYKIEGKQVLSVEPESINDGLHGQHTTPKRLLNSAPIVTNPPTSSSARSRLAKFSKMAFFGRTAKGVEPVSGSEQSKLHKKGPAAGTGHEGYGKHIRRGRKSSTDGSSAGTDSEGSVMSTTRRPLRSVSRRDSSVASQKSQSDLDDFVSSRLKPIVILGGSNRESPHFRDSYGQVVNMAVEDDAQFGNTGARHEVATKSMVVGSDLVAPQSHNTVHENFSRIIPVGKKQPSAGNGVAPVSVAGLYHVPRSPVQPYLNNWNTSESSMAPSSIAVTDTGNNPYHSESSILEKERKRGRKLRWNIFKRRESETEEDRTYSPQFRSVSDTGMAVSVSTMPTQRSVPYYAMMESESESNTAETLGDYLDEAARTIEFDDNNDDEGYVAPVEGTATAYRQKHESILLPSAPQSNPTIEPSRAAALHLSVDSSRATASEPGRMAQSQRPPRLAQVGRIPKVISTSQIRQPPRKSFSRPFQPRQTAGISESNIRSQKDNISVRESISEAHAHVMSKPPTFTSDQEHISGSLHPNIRYARNVTHHYLPESLKLFDRQSTTSSSSDGAISVMGPPLLPVEEITQRYSRRRTLAEEDVWNEFDDFIDHVTSPPRMKKSPAHAVEQVTVQERDRTPLRASASRTEVASLPILAQGLAIDTSFGTTPMIYASREVLNESESDHETRLRRSRIISALHSSIDPSSPFSVGDYLAEPNLPYLEGAMKSGHSSTYTAGGREVKPPRGFTSPKNLSASPLPQHYENITHIDQVQRSKNPARHSELSFTSLMVSRWLSFGRVLFSPAHADVQKQPERHVLVIDGLGSDDWSIYCAVTYQAEQAYIYDLKETGHTHASQPHRRADNVPSNFRRREMASFYHPIKFPDNFFSVIVLRFPPVMAESKLKNLVSECRRVLAPGGYMELMLLDLDIVNMGVLTRRALRDLKTKIAVADPGVSLKPVMDSFQSVLGENGFSKLSRCVVGVPVIGKPPGAASSPDSSRSSGGSDRQQYSPSVGPRPFAGLHTHSNHNFSLNDLVADHSDNADAKISKMVSRTARNWWQHCFEASIIPDGNLSRSIFADKKVLSECKTRASSFKLLIAYTQKPIKPALETKRRTMSEPIVATLATARTD